MSESNAAKERQQRIQNLIIDLNSRNERKVIGALKRVPHEGSPEMMEALFNLYAQSPSEDVVLLLEKSLHNLKDPACIEPMVDVLVNKEKEDQHAKVLSAFWQSGLDVSEHLTVIVDRAIEGDFITAMEALTVIENLEFSNDEALTTNIQKMDKAVEVKNDKQDLLVSLRQVLLDKLLGEQ
jgi:hypothetical protein